MKVMESLLGFFYPNKCILCQKILNTKYEGQYICSRCEEKFYSETKTLKHLYRHNTDKQVINCRYTQMGEIKSNQTDKEQQGINDFCYIEQDEEQTDNPSEIIALFPYEAEYRKAILRWKYRGIRKYARGFAELLSNEINFSAYEQAVFIPIPLAPSRKRKRGYNQALDLAKALGLLTQIPVVDCLVRHKDTRPQSQCTREERQHNIKNTMSIKKYICDEPKSILLIDDIYTTGSTIREAIRIINEQYAFRNAKIYVIVIGKGEL